MLRKIRRFPLGERLICYGNKVIKRNSDYTLSHHGASDLHEASDIGTLDVVDVAVGLFAVLDALLVDAVHDFVESLIDIGGTPAEVSGILAHFEAGSGYTACIDSLAGSVEHLLLDEEVDGFGGTSHVGDFGHALYTISDELGGIVTIEFVLGGAGERDVALALPWTLVGIEGSLGELVGIRRNSNT